jgi:hypothetical protein
MQFNRKLWLGLFAVAAAAIVASTPATAQQQQQQKPNILFIMGDDIGWMQLGSYQQGMGLGETPNLDRIANEGARFVHYYAEQSCTAGRNAFFTGMNPLRTGMIPPQLPGSPSYLRPGTPAVAKFLLDTSATTPASLARTTSAIIPTHCRRRTASRNSGVTFITSMPCNR